MMFVVGGFGIRRVDASEVAVRLLNRLLSSKRTQTRCEIVIPCFSDLVCFLREDSVI
jgi:hypothetical protein